MNQQTQSGVIAWFAGNPVAANLLMLIVIALGFLSFGDLRRESFPQREADTVTVSVAFNSGDPQLSEEGIAIKIEQALQSVLGIKRVTSVSNANGSTISVEKTSDYDLDILLRDIKSKVDAINNFPQDAEKPVVEKQTRLDHAYSIKIFGDAEQRTLQQLAEKIKADLLAQSGINNISVYGSIDPLIAIEIDDQLLQAYGISMSDVSNAINAESATAISSSVRNQNQLLRIKVADQAHYYQEFKNIPLKTLADGSSIRLSDIASIQDTFADDALVLARYNGEKGIGLEIKVDPSADVINIVEQANQVIARWQSSQALPDNVSVETWNDGGQLIKGRLTMLLDNALTGIALVFIVLALFLNLRVAFWVAAGLPFIFFGTLFFMGSSFTNLSINEMTTFGFILALGIVVDDAVVVGESVYSHRKKYGDSLKSTIAGTHQVAVPTIFGVLTTVATFAALSQVEGGLGKVYAQFAFIVTICLLLSVVESKLILPSHLAHLNTHRKIGSGWRNIWPSIQHAADSSLNWVNQKLYKTAIEYALDFRYAIVCLFVAIFILVTGFTSTGAVRTAFFPGIPGDTVRASLTMQNDASFGQTRENLLHLEQTALTVDRQLRSDNNQSDVSGISTIEVIATDDLSGALTIELGPDAPYSLNAFTNRWQQLAGNPAGAKKLNIRSGFSGPDNFRVELKAWDKSTLLMAGKDFKQALAETAGVYAIDDNFDSGQSQLKFELTEQGRLLGLTTADLSGQLLQAFGGATVQQFQRNTDEVKVRLRFPASQRQTIADVASAQIRLANGSSVPLSLVASMSSQQQQNQSTRISGLPAVYVSASVHKEQISSNELVDQLKRNLLPELQKTYPDLKVHFAGEAEQQAETTNSMLELFLLAMFVIYILLAVPLKSYIQPLIIMTAIPFGLVGAILGHWFNDMTLSILSFNGIIALSGVVVNDSLLLVSRFNQLRDRYSNSASDIRSAISEACSGRLRAVLLTSLTTYAGLMPILSETSPQAQFIIPAAASLGYGILFSTLITLILIPALLKIKDDVERLFADFTARLTGKSVAEQAQEEVVC